MNTPSTASAKKGAPASLPWVVAESKLLDNIAAARVKLENDDPDAYSMDRKEIYQWLAERLEIEGGYKRSAKAIESRLGGRLKFLPSPKKKTPSNSSESGPARKRARLSDHNDSEDAITVEARTPAKDSGVGDGDRVGEPAVAFHGSNTTRSEPPKTDMQKIENISPAARKPTISSEPKVDTPAPNVAQKQPDAATYPNLILTPTVHHPKSTSPAPPIPSEQSLESNKQKSDQLKLLAIQKADALKAENEAHGRRKEALLLARDRRQTEVRRLKAELDELSSQMESNEANLQEIEEKIARNEKGVQIFSDAAKF